MEAWNTDRRKHPKRASETMRSLEYYVDLKRGELNERVRRIPEMLVEADNLEKKQEKLILRHEMRLRNEYKQRVCEIRDTCVSIARGDELQSFNKLSSRYTTEYSKRTLDADANNHTCSNPAKKGTNIDGYVKYVDVSRQEAIVNEFLSDVNGEAPRMVLTTRDICPTCRETLTLMSAKSILTCQHCGYLATYLDATSSNMSYSDEVEFACFSYKRINHFNEWLQQVQAKESTDIKQEVLDMVMAELYANRVRDVSDITAKRVRDVLKSLRLRKTYDHVAQITSKITGREALKMPPEAEEMCRLMFIAVQPAFEKHCPKDRKNFLSYAYCLYKFFQLLGYDDLLDSFSLLKGRDKLIKQDQIFEKICGELGWEYMPSV